MTTLITGSQIRMARAALQIGVRELAEMSGVSAMTITRIENDRSRGQVGSLEKIANALQDAGVLFISENGGGPGVRLTKTSGRDNKI